MEIVMEIADARLGQTAPHSVVGTHLRSDGIGGAWKECPDRYETCESRPDTGHLRGLRVNPSPVTVTVKPYDPIRFDWRFGGSDGARVGGSAVVRR
jgi:hypothetical protein